jgi:hypothetical protein
MTLDERVAARHKEIEDGERAVRAEHADFEHVVRASGLWDQVMPDRAGRYPQPDLARIVYSAVNPAMVLLTLAREKMAFEARGDLWTPAAAERRLATS